jgi:aspartate aminotransferase-like enzyme
MSRKRILMIPGPSEVDPRVLATLSQPILPHYGIDWGAEYATSLEDLKKIFKTEEQVIIFPGPGNGAVELVGMNIIEPGDKIANVVNGWFGEILSEVIRTYGGEPVEIKTEYGRAISPADVEVVLDQEKDIKALFVVHNETSSGVENPIQEIGKVAKKHGVIYFVDAISSFGGVDIDLDSWNIDVCVGYPSKCLGGIHGAVPIAVGKRVWDEVETRRSRIPSRFMSLKVWKKFVQEWGPIGHPFPTSMPTTVILALHEAVKLALEEGLENRYRRHFVASAALRAGCKKIGFEPLVSEEARSKTVTILGVNDESKLRAILENKFNIMIAGGVSKLKGKAVRIGTMGVTASPSYVLPTLLALEVGARELGLPVTAGTAVAAGSKIFQSG